MADPRDEMSLEARLARIEARIDEQDAAIRRMLTLLVDWLEDDGDVPSQPDRQG